MEKGTERWDGYTDGTYDLQPTFFTLAPINANLYARRRSTVSSCPRSDNEANNIPSFTPHRPPAVPKRIFVPPPPRDDVKPPCTPPVVSTIRKRTLPPIPARSNIPANFQKNNQQNAQNIRNPHHHHHSFKYNNHKSQPNALDTQQNAQHSHQNVQPPHQDIHQNMQQLHQNIQQPNKNTQQSNKIIQQSNKNIQQSHQNIKQTHQNIQQTQHNRQQAQHARLQSQQSDQLTQQNIHQTSLNAQKSQNNAQNIAQLPQINSQSQHSSQQSQPNTQQSQPNPQQTKHNTQQSQHNPQQTKNNTQQSQHNIQQSQHNPLQSQHNPQQSQHNPQQSQHNPQQSQHNTQQSQQNSQQPQQNIQQSQLNSQQSQHNTQQSQHNTQQSQQNTQQPQHNTQQSQHNTQPSHPNPHQSLLGIQQSLNNSQSEMPHHPSTITKKISPLVHASNNIFEFEAATTQELCRQPLSTPGLTQNTRTPNKSPISPAAKSSCLQNSQSKVSVRQDSNVSSDSYSQTSSPSYGSKNMETPLIPPRNASKSNNIIKCQNAKDDNSTITKSTSTPAGLQTFVRFSNSSNMSLHHRILKDIRRPSTHYSGVLRFHFGVAQVLLNVLALIAIGVGMAAYFKAYPTVVQVIAADNLTKTGNYQSIIKERFNKNPAPGICLPVIVNFCKMHNVPYNYTVFPNYIGHFGQRDAEQELEMYEAIIDVRCYELAALFLCSVFVPKCGLRGEVVRPCRSLCRETKKRCGFFLDVFGLNLPDYLDCELFPESDDPEVCVGNREVREAILRAQTMVCHGFQCDVKRCIPVDWKCDGYIDCKDQTDEMNCSDYCGLGMIHCGHDKCMVQEHMCDGKIDCPHAQDEKNCIRLSERNGDIAKGQLEVFKPNLQTWVPACTGYWDQSYSENICTLLGYKNVNETRRNNVIYSVTNKETTAMWKMHQNSVTKNLMLEFRSCSKPYNTVEITCTDYICGKERKTYAERRFKRIVGGIRSKPGDWPFLVAILGGTMEIFYCAGVLIGDQWVLTASHCVGNHTDVKGWTVQLGVTRRHSHSYFSQKMKIKRVIPHPLYNQATSHDNDVALFQLQARVTFHEHLFPVCLPQPHQHLLPGTKCKVIGWGKKEDNGLSEYEPEINEVDVPVVSREECNNWLRDRDLNVTDGMICAGYKEGGKDACQGDSGGPLLCKQENDKDQWFVGGIVSWGIKCAHPSLPGVYAFIPKYVPWIMEQIRAYEDT